ncbi:MAG: RsmG family class I SAM-dependent methyltransferase [Balneolaceae bacterium]|nr:RsmG family class I SAM-dependent methyltransferase [Balneolaceae bacterium]
MKQHKITYQAVPRETFDNIDEIIERFRVPLQSYLDQLFWWNERINLISRDVSRETAWDHIRHSLLLKHIPIYQSNSIIVDAGTGGGLPGLPLSITTENKQFVLNDIVTKKILAVKQIARKLSLENVSTDDGSIAELSIGNPFLLISKHAFKINDLFHLTNDLPWTGMIFYKGIHFKDELEGINSPLSIIVYDLFEESQDSFYKDKAIIQIEKNKH